VRAWETADVNALLALLKDHASFSMPPIPSWYQGRETIRRLVSATVFSGEAHGRWRLLPTRANRQFAFGLYRRGEAGSPHHAYGVQVLTFEDELIADITTFINPTLCGYFRLPPVLPS
jgi:RNA polymerase sigma-70 factor (ECF subfamily)